MPYKTFIETLQDITESTNRRGAPPKSDLQEALMEIIEALCDHFDLDLDEEKDPYKKQKKNRAKSLERNPKPVPASKHGPTDAKPVDPKRPGARYGPTI